MKNIAAFLSGVGVAIAIAFGVQRRTSGSRGTILPLEPARLDLNSAPEAELRELGIPAELAAAIVENRPYRSKLELVERYVLPTDVYAQIRGRIIVNDAAEPVKIAS